ncbi:MAG TPA: hypothetical protein VGA44_09945 [Steroidobacteraceae bacterium]
MPACRQLVQAEKLERRLDTVAQRDGALRRRRRCRRRVLLELPATAPVKGFREDPSAIRKDIDPHSPGPIRDVPAVNLEGRLLQREDDRNTLDGLDRSTPAPRGGVLLDERFDGLATRRASRGKQHGQHDQAVHGNP